MMVELFTDGAVSGNPGPGGWGVLFRLGSHTKTLAGGELNTTNNRMEMMAVIVGLESLNRPCEVTVTTDSEYVMKGMTEWMAGWERKGRMDPNGKKPVANLDLWLRLKAAAARHTVHWAWVRGHNGHTENEIADKLAGEGKALVQSHGESARLVNGELVAVSALAPV